MEAKVVKRASMRVVRGCREGLEIDERAGKESEMIRMGVGEDESVSGSRCSRQLKIAYNSVVIEEAVLR